MALKALMLRRQIDLRKKDLNALTEARKGLDQKREELEKAIGEVETDEQREAVAAEVEAFEREERENAEKAEELEKAITDLEGELAEEEKNQDTTPKEGEGEDQTRKTGAPARAENERSEIIMNKRNIFSRMDVQTRDTFFQREDVKTFVEKVRTMGRERRTISGGELTIPEVMLPMIKEQVEAGSKLLKYVNAVTVRGTSREIVMGTIPEAVWTEMCANLNELALAFNDVEVDGYKVGGFIPVCNALLEDNDVNLASEIIFALGRAIAIALDKAILYGTGTKMPLGIVTRLAQTEQPTGYSSTERPWADLHATNIQKITAANSTGITLFQKILEIFGNAKKKYGAGGKFWAMNEKTHMALVGEAMSFNANGAIVTGINNTMPVIGGDIVELDFIPDNNIIAGYGELYLLAERAGVKLASSEHFLFTSDKTVFKGTARYDGKPVIAEGFVVIGVNNTTPSTTVTFAADSANP